MHPLNQRLLSLSRRGFLRGVPSVAAVAALTGTTAQGVWAQPVFRTYPFTLGVASGEPLPDGVVIWTRLAPEPMAGGGMPMRAVEVGYEVASDDRFRTVVQRGTALARPELGHSVHVEVSGLQPGRHYWYRFRAGAELSATGRTKAAPAEGATPENLRFATAGCQRYEDGHFTAWSHVAAEELDFVFHYGDYIYEYRARRGAERPVREIVGDEIHTIVDYRNRYALYKQDPDLAAAHAAHPFLVSYDDHEVDNNWAGAISEEDGSASFPIAVPPEIFAFRKQMALQAWWENAPLRRGALPRGTDITAYRRLRYGNLAQVNVLDTRQFRDDQPCGDGVKPGCDARLDPNAQILGAAQERWLMDGLAASPARWNILAQQVSIMQRGFGQAPNIAYSMDKWDAYAAARDRLLSHVHARGVKNLVVLTGDVHNGWAGTLKLNFEDANSPTVGTEFIATSISATGDGSESRADWAQVQSNNPHIGYYNNRRGYLVNEATAERMVAHFRGVDFVTRPGAPLVTKASFAVAADEPKLVRI